MAFTRGSRTLAGVVAAAAVSVSLTAATATAAPGERANKPENPGGFTLTILHANDQESALLPIERRLADGTTVEVAGAARLAALAEREQQAAVTGKPAHPGAKRGVITISGGDNFLPGAQLDASRQKAGQPIYDALAFNATGYDVSGIGNHDFDLTPDFFAEFIAQTKDTATYASANLDFTGEPVLQALVEDGTVVESTVVKERGERIGVIGLTTPDLASLTSSRNVKVLPALADIANAQAAALESAGVNKIILVSHLQDIDNEIALVPQLHGVDVVVGAGGGEIMADPDHALLPGDTRAAAYEYPQVVTAKDGAEVPVVTTSGLYRYLGRLVVHFDKAGEVVSVDEEASRPIPAVSYGPDAVTPSAEVRRSVEEPVAEFVEQLDQMVVATSEVPLNGRRADVRSRETNLGDLVADSLLWSAEQRAAEFGVRTPQVALQNGGGIRNDSVLPPGELTMLDTYNITPFPNFVAVAPSVPVEDLVAAVDHGSIQGAGSFAQIAGFSYTYDPAGAPGSRVVDLTLDDGTQVVSNGQIVAPFATISVASIDFLLRGNDGYDVFRDDSFTVLPLTQQEALASYLRDGLGGTVSAAEYPVIDPAAGADPTRIVRLG